jgi:menaquinone-dependent protoporphyrinogen oxidase
MAGGRQSEPLRIMKKILIAYATTDGQTRKIAETLAKWLGDGGYIVNLFDTRLGVRLKIGSDVTGCILAGSLHLRKHQKALLDFAQDHSAELSHLPTAFFSVSATGSRTDAKSVDEAKKCIDGFVDESGFHPSIAFPTGGAIKYTHYNPLVRMIMKHISAKENGPTDTSRDHELTDWERLRANSNQFLTEFIENKSIAPPKQCCGKCGGKCSGDLPQIETINHELDEPVA